MRHGLSMAEGDSDMNGDKITLAHGAGGRLSQELTEQLILPELGNSLLNTLHDGAVLNIAGGQVAFTTDSYVVKPLFFSGGSIGKLAVCGTVNDLAMTGAEARYLSLGFILEEGLELTVFKQIIHDIALAAAEAGVKIVTGDTKVVGHGAADGIFINTAGIGEVIPNVSLQPVNIKPGMDIILSGTIGDHAATVMAARHDLILPPEIKSDCAPLNELTKAILTAAPDTAVMRDPTRGGLAAVLNELAGQSGTGMLIEEEKIPIKDEVRGVCDILGLDPLYLANEGKLVAIVPAERTENVLRIMHETVYGKEACCIGKVTSVSGEVGLLTALGSIRLVDMPMGNIVPRIC